MFCSQHEPAKMVTLRCLQMCTGSWLRERFQYSKLTGVDTWNVRILDIPLCCSQKYLEKDEFCCSQPVHRKPWMEWVLLFLVCSQKNLARNELLFPTCWQKTVDGMNSFVPGLFTVNPSKEWADVVKLEIYYLTVWPKIKEERLIILPTVPFFPFARLGTVVSHPYYQQGFVRLQLTSISTH